MPLTLVGNISEHRMLGIGPNPIEKKHPYDITLTVETIALTVFPTSTILTMTRVMRDTVSTGFVLNNKLLQ